MSGLRGRESKSRHKRIVFSGNSPDENEKESSVNNRIYNRRRSILKRFSVNVFRTFVRSTNLVQRSNWNTVTSRSSMESRNLRDFEMVPLYESPVLRKETDPHPEFANTPTKSSVLVRLS